MGRRRGGHCVRGRSRGRRAPEETRTPPSGGFCGYGERRSAAALRFFARRSSHTQAIYHIYTHTRIRAYFPGYYHRERRLGPLNARPPLPRLRGLPKLAEKDAMHRALGFVQRAMGEDGAVPPARALQKELWSLFSGDTSNGKAAALERRS